jgi:hypothetical protein
MTLALRELPDGSHVRIGGDVIAVVTDEPASLSQLQSFVAFARASLLLLPTYLLPRTN